MHVCVCTAMSKSLDRSCAVWIFRPLLAVCQDDVSFIRYPMFHEHEHSSLNLAIWLCFHESTPMVLETITNDVVCELLARNDDYLK